MAKEDTDVRKLDEAAVSPDVNFSLTMSIKGTSVTKHSIQTLVIREWIFDLLPRIEIEILDSGWFIDKFPFEDNDVIKVELDHLSDGEGVVKTEFLLHDIEIINAGVGKAEQALVKITGILKTDNFPFEIKNRAFSQKTSDEVFEELSNDIGFNSFTSRVTSKDKMSWIQSHQSDFDFSKHVLKRSFVNENDTTFLYSDRDGNCVFTSLQTELENENKPKIAMFNLEASLLNNINMQEDEYDEKVEDLKEQEGSENLIFYRQWYFKNFQGTSNKENSYGRTFSFNNTEDYVNRTMKDDKHDLTVHSLKEKDKIGKFVKNDTFGILDILNTHPEYFLSMVQNEYLKENFFANSVVLYTKPNEELKLFDKINLIVPTYFKADSEIDIVHSGMYIVGGIIHEVQKSSIYSTIVILFRNGLNLSDTQLKDFESRHSSSDSSKKNEEKKTIL